MKVCKKCSVAKSLDQFYQKANMADGHLNACIECVKTYEKNRRLKIADHLQAYENARANLPHRMEARRQYAQTEAGKKAHHKAMQNYNKKYPLAYAAKIITGNALRDGRLIKGECCEACQATTKIEGHHDDYTKPLNVRWLCEACHKAWHRQHVAIYE